MNTDVTDLQIQMGPVEMVLLNFFAPRKSLYQHYQRYQR